MLAASETGAGLLLSISECREPFLRRVGKLSDVLIKCLDLVPSKVVPLRDEVMNNFGTLFLVFLATGEPRRACLLSKRDDTWSDNLPAVLVASQSFFHFLMACHATLITPALFRDWSRICSSSCISSEETTAHSWTVLMSRP